LIHFRPDFDQLQVRRDIFQEVLALVGNQPSRPGLQAVYRTARDILSARVAQGCKDFIAGERYLKGIVAASREAGWLNRQDGFYPSECFIQFARFKRQTGVRFERDGTARLFCEQRYRLKVSGQGFGTVAQANSTPNTNFQPNDSSTRPDRTK
jgi:hypothetical protein